MSVARPRMAGQRGRAGRGVRERVSRLLNACSLTRLPLSEAERFLLGEISRLALEGLGSYRIGRRLWPNLNPRTAQKRVQRLLAKWGPLCPKNGAGVSLDVSINPEETQRRGRKPEDVSIARLGPTLKLVIAALKTLGGRARFSATIRSSDSY